MPRFYELSECTAMLRKTASIYRGVPLVSHSNFWIIWLCWDPNLGCGEVWRDPLLSCKRVKSEMSCLSLQDVRFSIWFCAFFFASFLVSILLSLYLVLSMVYVWWFCFCCLCHRWLLATTTTASHGCFDGQGSENLTSELSSHWIKFSRDSTVFRVWIILKLLYDVLLILKLARELGYGFPFSRPNHAYLNVSSMSYVRRSTWLCGM